jgi:hypothetical protein
MSVLVLAVLRDTAPPPEQRTAAQQQLQQPVRFRPTPTTPPRGNLPAPAVTDTGRNLVVGHIPLTGAKPGKDTVLLEVDQILDWYCPESVTRTATVRDLGRWQSAEVTTRPHPGTEITLELKWTGSSYRWQGPYDRLDRCW